VKSKTRQKTSNEDVVIIDVERR